MLHNSVTSVCLLLLSCFSLGSLCVFLCVVAHLCGILLSKAVIYYCRGCGRYLSPPDTWISAALESRELLALCLKRLKGLSKVRILHSLCLYAIRCSVGGMGTIQVARCMYRDRKRNQERDTNREREPEAESETETETEETDG